MGDSGRQFRFRKSDIDDWGEWEPFESPFHEDGFYEICTIPETVEYELTVNGETVLTGVYLASSNFASSGSRGFVAFTDKGTSVSGAIQLTIGAVPPRQVG